MRSVSFRTAIRTARARPPVSACGNCSAKVKRARFSQLENVYREHGDENSCGLFRRCLSGSKGEIARKGRETDRRKYSISINAARCQSLFRLG